VLMGHHVAQSWANDMAWSGGDLWRRGQGEEGSDMWVNMPVREERECD
jgi:hypothetical protein